jgi:hypothetical protein
VKEEEDMDEAYQEYYRAAFQQFAEWPEAFRAELPPYFEEASAIYSGIEAIAERLPAETGKTLRADARLLLLINAWQMVLQPILEVRERQPGVVVGEVLADIELVVARAAEAPHIEEISGHRIVDALSDSWDQLRIGAWGLWE